MAKTRSMTKNHNHDDDDASIRKRTKTWHNDSVAPWSDLNHDVLFLVMMELGVFDFVSFSGVCKSWRSLALPNKITFMASKPPMELFWISEEWNNTYEYSLLDFKGRSFKILLPESGGRRCVGITCGYLVLYGRKPCAFFLMNPITRHGICFPKVPHYIDFFYLSRGGLRAILVFSPSIFTWVLVVVCRYTTRIWFSIAGKGEWDYVSSNYCIVDVHEFKGRIYVIDVESRLFELGLDLEPKLMLLNTKNPLERNLTFQEFVSSGENLYALECIYSKFYSFDYKIHKLDFGEMKWVSQEENTTEHFAFFVNNWKNSAAIKPGLWFESDSWLRFKYMRSSVNIMFLKSGIWYFPHDCLKINFKHE